ncbi:MAG: hypothetical protein HKO63_00240 [Acidimicrobiia bacterium]|nr:hypothetical protein [Acidimicrobiia bacterium]NNF87780.1 hypothetical protein [Acidimicrobiia bacterium]NNL96608.1 hypothetical protein [Acidimicrobiia bacterium]RZV42979.1 MAG: hypothetical protein EX267_08925 [Acidimicrobiia bacterium]
MSWPTRRGVLLLLAGILSGLGSALIWPGDLNNEPLTWAHRVAVGGFLLTAVLLVLGAVMILIAVTGAAWSVKNFDLDQYLDDMKKDR